jgi:hypothetical protein
MISSVYNTVMILISCSFCNSKAPQGGRNKKKFQVFLCHFWIRTVSFPQIFFSNVLSVRSLIWWPWLPASKSVSIHTSWSSFYLSHLNRSPAVEAVELPGLCANSPDLYSPTRPIYQYTSSICLTLTLEMATAMCTESLWYLLNGNYKQRE